MCNTYCRRLQVCARHIQHRSALLLPALAVANSSVGNKTAATALPPAPRHRLNERLNEPVLSEFTLTTYAPSDSTMPYVEMAECLVAAFATYEPTLWRAGMQNGKAPTTTDKLQQMCNSVLSMSTVEQATAFVVRDLNGRVVGTVFLLPVAGGGELARPASIGSAASGLSTNSQDIRAHMFKMTTDTARMQDTAHLGPHYYVGMFAIAPNFQQRGLGAALLAAMAEDADAAQVPVFLYTGNMRNVRFYQKSGFCLCNQRGMAAGGPHGGPFTMIVYSLVRSVFRIPNTQY